MSAAPDHAAPWLAEHHDDLVAFRRDLHMHPELGHEELRTTEQIRERIVAAGMTPQPLGCPTGMTVDIGSGDGPVIVLRADIDALPLEDAKQVPYRSTVSGRAHACGHDVHTSVLLGAGLVLAGLDAASPLPGTVRLVFQPAEETMPGGAHDVLAAGAMDGVRMAFACHCDPTVTVGSVGTRVGAITSASDSLEVVLTGPGGHTSRPYRTVDLVSAMGAVITQVPAALRSLVDTRSGVSLVWGMANSGSVQNAIPQRAVLRGTVRMLDAGAWHIVPDLLERLVSSVAGVYGAKAETTYLRGVPPVVNEARSNSLLSHAAEAVLGSEHVVPTNQSLGGEDFGWLLEKTPGAMFRLGVRPEGWTGPDLDLHQGTFDVDEACIGVGVRVMVRTALDALDVE